MSWMRLGALGAYLALGMPANATTIGGYNVDTTKEIDLLSIVSGDFAPLDHGYLDLVALGNNWGGLSGLPSPVANTGLSFLGSNPGGPNPNTIIQGWLESPITNQPGLDFLAFESGDTPTDVNGDAVSAIDPSNDEVELLAVSLGGASGTWFDLMILSFLTGAQVGEAGVTAAGVYVLGLDLSDLGLPNGASVSSLFFGNSASYLDHDPDIIYAAGAGVSAVPLPAALPLFATALGAMGWFGWHRRRHTSR